MSEQNVSDRRERAPAPTERDAARPSQEASDGVREANIVESNIVLEKPTTAQLLGRGLTRRCPWCGDRRAYFTSWWNRSDRCRSCRRGYRRGDDAFELGAITVNIIFTFLCILLALVAVFVVVFGVGVDVSLYWIVGIGAFFVLVAPALFYPLSFTVWQAIDLFMREPTEEELAGGEDAKL